MEITDLSWSEDREWLITNGLGGYSSSTLIGLNTRRYHGLLVAAFSPEDRRVLLSKIDEEVVLDGQTYKLSTNQYWDAIEPKGYKYLKEFRLDPGPTFIYELSNLRLRKSIFMPHEKNAVVIKYAIEGDQEVTFNANLLNTSRDHHSVIRNPDWNPAFEKKGEIALLTPGHKDPPILCIGSTKGELYKPDLGDNIVRGLFYRKELERGYPNLDDVFIGTRLETKLNGGEEFYIVCATDFSQKCAIDTCKRILKSPSVFEEEETKRKKVLINNFYNRSKHKPTGDISQLISSSEGFIIKKGASNAIIAGYPWFGEWGRDSLISLPGLCLTTGRKREAERVFVNLLKEAKDGIIPNNFMGGKNLGSIDTSLWLFWAVWKYLEYTGDYGFVKRRLWTGMKNIVRSYLKMTDSDGLITTSSWLPMTWMDAVVGGNPVTLRSGKAVEVQALWFNALTTFAKLATGFGEHPKPYSDVALKCKESFNNLFWNPETGYPFDVIDGGLKDGSIRPNALLAVSLPFPILAKDRWKGVVDVAQRELLTPFGIRTLNQTDWRYKWSAQGNQIERDLAYHQGDVWPWLLGPFIDAYKRVYQGGAVGHFLKPLIEGHTRQACLGCISEVFGGSHPHLPEGCINQAWSVAEILRILSEDQSS
jgi:predicted glycogen debranching enzyme